MAMLDTDGFPGLYHDGRIILGGVGECADDCLEGVVDMSVYDNGEVAIHSATLIGGKNA